MKAEKKQIQRQFLVGKVTSTKTKTTNTIHVSVERSIEHPLYRKKIRRSKSYAAHNKLPDIQEGDTVWIGSIRPMSKTKHFEVVEKVKL